MYLLASEATLGVANESTDVGKENLPQLQNHPPQARGSGHLQESAAQAAAGINRHRDCLAQAIDF